MPSCIRRSRADRVKQPSPSHPHIQQESAICAGVPCDLRHYSPRWFDTENGFMSRSSVMFVVGIAMVVGAALGMLSSSVDMTPLTVILIIGVVFIAVGARERGTQ